MTEDEDYDLNQDNDNDNDNENNNNDDDNDDDGVISDENIETPTSPPKKPPNLTLFYIESNKHRFIDSHHSAAEVNNILKTEWKEKLGKTEKQKYKKKHKNAKKKFDKLLEKYKAANPDFDDATYYDDQKNEVKKKKNKNSVSGQKRGRSSTKRGPKNDFSMHTFSEDEYDNNQNNNNNDDNYHNNNNNPSREPRTKKRKVSLTDTNNSSQLIDKILHDINKSGNRGKRRPKEENFTAEKEDLSKMQALVEGMRNAAQLDWKANIEKKPAINTLKMLDSVISELSKKLFYKDFVEQCDVLEAIRDWIHPLPDGSLPPLKIRTEMYRIISKFQLHNFESLSSNLHESEQKTQESNKSEYHPNIKGFGKTLMNLWSNKNETAENKLMLRKMMEKWIRTLTQANVSYSEAREETQLQQTKNDIIRRNQILQKQGQNYDLLSNQKRARIPEKAWFDFTIQPRSTIDETDHEQRQQRRNPTHASIDDKLRSLNRNYSKQAVRPSLTGRRAKM